MIDIQKKRLTVVGKPLILDNKAGVTQLTSRWDNHYATTSLY
jgi:hypothetical protein